MQYFSLSPVAHPIKRCTVFATPSAAALTSVGVIISTQTQKGLFLTLCAYNPVALIVYNDPRWWVALQQPLPHSTGAEVMQMEEGCN